MCVRVCVAVSDCTKSVPVDEFPQYVRKMHENKDSEFEKEFRVRPHPLWMGSCSISCPPYLQLLLLLLDVVVRL